MYARDSRLIPALQKPTEATKIAQKQLSRITRLGSMAQACNSKHRGGWGKKACVNDWEEPLSSTQIPRASRGDPEGCLVIKCQRPAGQSLSRKGGCTRGSWLSGSGLPLRLARAMPTHPTEQITNFRVRPQIDHLGSCHTAPLNSTQSHRVMGEPLRKLQRSLGLSALN